VKTDSANDELMLSLKLSLGQWERKVIGERTRAALTQKKLDGCYLGQVPYGWRLENGKLVQDPHEQEVIEIIRNLKTAGMSYRQIAKELNHAGHTTKRGAAWGPSQVLRTYREAA
jgi:site-specific DNA recombinase